jgi:predicted DNA binding CopG/RHH family protein
MKKIPKLKKIPKFKSEKGERDFWQEADSLEYLDWSKAKNITFPNLKPSTTTISLRLPEWLLDDIRSAANKIDVPYQSFIKTLLADGISPKN